MESVKIEANIRNEVGKEAVKKVRKGGFVPGVVYGSDINKALSISQSSLKVLRGINFSESTVIEMDFVSDDKMEPISVLIKKVQFNPLTEEVSHIDFLKVSLKEKIKVHVPIILKGEAKGLKEGGVLEQLLREISVEGLPLDVPEKIEMDISDLDIGHSLHVSDLSITENIKVITDPGAAIVTIVAKKEEVEEKAVEEEGEAAAEPEVIKEKKETAETKEKKEEKSK